MKLPVAITTLVALLVLPACDDKKDEPKRPDLAEGSAGKDAGKAAPVDTKAPVASGRVFFVSPADGAKVPEQFDVEFGVEGKQIEPVGTNTERNPAVGHHHVIIDGGPMPDMTVIPKDETHLHYGDGATKATIKLPPGKHTLTMQFGDAGHRSYGPDWAATITVDVQPGAGGAPSGDAAAPGAAPAAGGAAAPGGAPAGDAAAPGGAPAGGTAPSGDAKGG